MRDEVRRRLIESAKQGETITYGELMREFRISRRYIGREVGAISEYEYDNRRPLLSSIVVNANSRTKDCPKGHPGGGFFGLQGIPPNLTRQPGDFENPLNANERAFVKAEQERVWGYWRTHSH